MTSGTPNGNFYEFFSLFRFFIAMPLPPPKSPRTRAHNRRIDIQGFVRDDGLFDLDARLTDLKDIDYPLSSGLRKRGDPVHDLFIRVTIDPQFSIEACVTSVKTVPNPRLATSVPWFDSVLAALPVFALGKIWLGF